MHHDVALALRIRDVNSALCNTLDASVREVGDAVVRHEAAATGAMSAAALLGDVTRRIEELMRIVAGAEPATGSSPADAATAADIGSASGAPAPPALGRMFSARDSPLTVAVDGWPRAWSHRAKCPRTQYPSASFPRT